MDPVSYTHLDVYKRQSFNDLGFAKITLIQSEEGIADVYFKRCGSYVLMIETVFIPSRWQEIDDILHTMKIPN